MKKIERLLTWFLIVGIIVLMSSCGVSKKSIMKDLVEIPGEDILMLKTEVTQKLYKSVMGENPSHFKGKNKPVEYVSWYDAIVFCNKLSEKCGVTPVYYIDGKADVSTWNYTPHRKAELEGTLVRNSESNGFRLPEVEEWVYAERGGQDYEYSGSDNLDEVGWYKENSGKKTHSVAKKKANGYGFYDKTAKTHSVAKKKANGYGLFDMNGNVWEWCWDSDSDNKPYLYGGSYESYQDWCKSSWVSHGHEARDRLSLIGFRIVRDVEQDW